MLGAWHQAAPLPFKTLHHEGTAPGENSAPKRRSVRGIPPEPPREPTKARPTDQSRGCGNLPNLPRLRPVTGGRHPALSGTNLKRQVGSSAVSRPAVPLGLRKQLNPNGVPLAPAIFKTLGEVTPNLDSNSVWVGTSFSAQLPHPEPSAQQGAPRPAALILSLLKSDGLRSKRADCHSD